MGLPFRAPFFQKNFGRLILGCIEADFWGVSTHFAAHVEIYKFAHLRTDLNSEIQQEFIKEFDVCC